MKKNGTVLLLIGAEKVREGLQALLEAIPGIGKVVSLDSLYSSSSCLDRLDPSLTVLELDPEVSRDEKALFRVKETFPHTKIIVLVENDDGKARLRMLGVDEVLVKGFRGQSFVNTVQNLIEPG